MGEKGPWFRAEPWLLTPVGPRRGLVGPGLTGSGTAAPPEPLPGPPTGRGRVLGLGWNRTTRAGACWRAAATGGDLAAGLPWGVAAVTAAAAASREVGGARPWMVAETRAETAPGKGGEEPGGPGGGLPGAPVQGGGLRPPADRSVSGEDRVRVAGPSEEWVPSGWIPLAESFGVPSDWSALGWTGGGGARPFTLGDSERGALSPGAPGGTGGAGDFKDLRLGPAEPDPEGGWRPGETEGRSAWGESSAEGPQTGPASP